MEIVIAITAALAIIFAGSVIFSPTWRMRRRLQRARPTTITDTVDESAARITGTVSRGTEILRAPLSGRPCCAYTLKVLEKRNNSWQEIVHLTEGTEFYLRDETSRARIVAEDASVNTTPDFETNETTVALREFLARSEMGDDWTDGRTLRFVESVVSEDAMLTVVGITSRAHGEVIVQSATRMPLALVEPPTANALACRPQEGAI